MYRFVSVFVLLSLVYAKNEIYEGHSVFEINVKNVDEIKLVNEIENQLDLDVWSIAVLERAGQVLVPKEKRQQLEDALTAAGIEYKVAVENVKELIDLEEELLAKASARSANRTVEVSFDRIYTYAEVDTFLETLASAYPDTVTLVNAGTSFEGRNMKYLKISTTNFQDTSKPVVYMESLLHAREWVTLPATLYAIHKLVIDVTEQDLLQDIDWIILPIANPDGYVYTHTTSRFWRKNRATGYMIGNVCAGVDLNRNFDIFWSEASSNSVCSDTFHGRGPSSEPETSIIRDIIDEHKDRIELYLDIHSFGSMILFGYGTGVLPPNALIVNLVGVRMAQAIDAVKESFNPNYIVGNVAFVLYEASGSSKDYAQSVGVPLSYTFELPAYRLSSNTVLGFMVDPNFIEQAGFETWEGIKAGARYARDNYRMRRSL